MKVIIPGHRYLLGPEGGFQHTLGVTEMENAERQSRREATYSERSCSPGGPTC